MTLDRHILNLIWCLADVVLTILLGVLVFVCAACGDSFTALMLVVSMMALNVASGVVRDAVMAGLRERAEGRETPTL